MENPFENVVEVNNPRLEAMKKACWYRLNRFTNVNVVCHVQYAKYSVSADKVTETIFVRG